jgi:hypothetical protein
LDLSRALSNFSRLTANFACKRDLNGDIVPVEKVDA